MLGWLTEILFKLINKITGMCRNSSRSKTPGFSLVFPRFRTRYFHSTELCWVFLGRFILNFNQRCTIISFGCVQNRTSEHSQNIVQKFSLSIFCQLVNTCICNGKPPRSIINIIVYILKEPNQAYNIYTCLYEYKQQKISHIYLYKLS